MYAKIIISCGYELFCDKIEASFLVRSFGCAFFVLWEEKAMNFDLHKFVSEAEVKIPETVSDSSGAVLTPGKPQTCEGNGSNDAYEICCDECVWFLACFPEYCDSSYSPTEELPMNYEYKDVDSDLPF